MKRNEGNKVLSLRSQMNIYTNQNTVKTYYFSKYVCYIVYVTGTQKI